MPPSGQRDYSTVRITRHALERFQERFANQTEPLPFNGAQAEAELRRALQRTRRLGKNAKTNALAVLAVHRNRPLVAVLQDEACLTVLTWPQFVPKLAEFGRPKIPRKWGRLLRRLTNPDLDTDADADAETESSIDDPDWPATND